MRIAGEKNVSRGKPDSTNGRGGGRRRSNHDSHEVGPLFCEVWRAFSSFPDVSPGRVESGFVQRMGSLLSMSVSLSGSSCPSCGPGGTNEAFVASSRCYMSKLLIGSPPQASQLAPINLSQTMHRFQKVKRIYPVDRSRTQQRLELRRTKKGHRIRTQKWVGQT